MQIGEPAKGGEKDLNRSVRARAAATLAGRKNRDDVDRAAAITRRVISMAASRAAKVSNPKRENFGAKMSAKAPVIAAFKRADSP